MSSEIRPITTDAEEEQHGFISAYSFNGDRNDDALARRRGYYQRDWCLGAFDGGELVAGLVMLPFEQYINGGRVPLGGIASVSCLPERRRSGQVGALVRASLASMRERGQWLSALYTPHYSLYRKFGWEIAGRILSYSFAPKLARPRLAAPSGRCQRIGPDGWEELDTLHQRHYRIRNGALVRTEGRWRSHVFSDYGKGQRDAAVWLNSDGQARGYVVYHSINRPPSEGHTWGETILRVDDWIALDGGAYTAILAYLLGHDLVSQIIMLAGIDEPFADVFEEPAHIKEPAGAWPGPMLRLVDVQRAIEARPAMALASGKNVTLALTDATAPWNAGVWRIESHEGRMSAEKTDSKPDLEMDACALGPIYNGHRRPAEAIRAGTVRMLNERALPAFTDLFSTSFSPYCPDDF